MSDLPDISVVMSVYNGADRLPETMESVLSQEGVSLEFIIVDDGSTDGSDVTLGNYAVVMLVSGFCIKKTRALPAP